MATQATQHGEERDLWRSPPSLEILPNPYKWDLGVYHDTSGAKVPSQQLGLTFRNDPTRRWLQFQDDRKNRSGRDFKLQLSIEI